MLKRRCVSTGQKNSDLQKQHHSHICLSSILDFVNFLSYPFFRTGSIAQNKSIETPERFESLKKCVNKLLPNNTKIEVAFKST